MNEVLNNIMILILVVPIMFMCAVFAVWGCCKIAMIAKEDIFG